MPLQIMDPTVMQQLTMPVQQALSQLTNDQQQQFVMQFKARAKSSGLIIALAIFCPIQLFLLGKTGLAIAFILTSGGCGIWWIVEIFMAAGRVKQYNETVAWEIINTLKMMSH